MYFANDITTIYVLRFLAGIGAGGEYGVGITLIAESFRHDQIGKMTSVAAIGGQVGAIFAALAAAIIIPQFGWHALFLMGVLPVILTFFIRRHLNESSEFLAAQQDEDPAKSIDCSPIQHASCGPADDCLDGHGHCTNRGIFWPDELVTRDCAEATGLIRCGFIIMDDCDNRWDEFGDVNIWEYPRSFGPRRAFSVFLLASALVVFAITWAHSTWTLVIIGAIVGFFSNGMFGGYGAVISRLYPTEIRSTANNVIMNTGRAIGGFSSVMIGVLMDHYTLSVTMASLSALYLLSFVVMITLPGIKRLTVSR